MMSRSLLVLATVSGIALPASAAPLAPHRAVYELKLASDESEIVDAQARIAMELRTDTCGSYDLDYRFVARFQQEQEITLTDQRTNSVESQSGTSFSFTTKTFVDGSPEKEISGKANQDGAATKVSMTAPERKTFDLPSSRFPMQHTSELIAKAKAGERIVETRLFDGDDDAQKLLSSTAIIAPVTEGSTPAADADKPGNAAAATKALLAPAIEKTLAGLRSWRITESYYNSDSDPDGMPIFETRYRLYENGVSDDLKLDFGDYAFEGTLSSLNLLDGSKCK